MKIDYPPIRDDLSFHVKLSIVTTSIRNQLNSNLLIDVASKYVQNANKLTLFQADLTLPIIIALKDKASPIFKLNATKEYVDILTKAESRVADLANKPPVIKQKGPKVVKVKDDTPKLEQLTKVDVFVDGLFTKKVNKFDFPVFDFSVVTKAAVIGVILEYVVSIKKDFETILDEETTKQTGKGDYYMTYDKDTVTEVIESLTALIKSIKDIDTDSGDYKKRVKESKKATSKLTKSVISESKKPPKISMNSKFGKGSITSSKLVVLSKESEPHLIIVLSSLNGGLITMKSAKRTDIVNIQQFKIKSAGNNTNWPEVIKTKTNKSRQSPFTISDDVLIHYCEK